MGASSWPFYWGERLANNIRVTFLIAWLTACAQVSSPLERGEYAGKIATQAGWKLENIVTEDFTLRAYLPPITHKTATLTIYIEGDGLAWITSSSPSYDPTPVDPLALKLALHDTAPSVYLARPCQYVGAEQQPNCAQKFWTSHRFAPEVIHSSNQAIDQLKQRFGADKLILVGYSGGGAVAALVAAGRQDVARLITVAGNLDHQRWTVEHHLSPLFGSLNPADAWQPLQHVPQTHFVGGNDRAVGETISRAYAARFPVGYMPEIVVISNFDHHCCWEDHWPDLKNQVRQ